MLTFPASEPVDAVGRLLHEDDAAAQLALAMSRLEAALDAAGRSPEDLTSVRVLTTDRPALDRVYDVLTERLDALGIDPVVTVETARLAVPGMVVALVAATTDVRTRAVDPA